MFAAVSSRNARAYSQLIISSLSASSTVIPLLFNHTVSNTYSRTYTSTVRPNRHSQSRALSSRRPTSPKSQKGTNKPPSWTPEGDDFIEGIPDGHDRRNVKQQQKKKKWTADTLPWQVERRVVKEKYPEGYDPRKKLSPDALDGIRALNAQQPEVYTTDVLAKEFEVSPEAIRRILKSKWRPNGKEAISRQERWEKRGVGIWAAKAALGEKPPVRWRRVIEDTLAEGGREAVEKLVQSSAAQAIIETGIERKKKAYEEKLELWEEEAALARIQAEVRARKSSKKARQAKVLQESEAVKKVGESEVSWMKKPNTSNKDSLSIMDNGFDDTQDSLHDAPLEVTQLDSKHDARPNDSDLKSSRKGEQTESEARLASGYPELVFSEPNRDYTTQSL